MRLDMGGGGAVRPLPKPRPDPRRPRPRQSNSAGTFDGGVSPRHVVAKPQEIVYVRSRPQCLPIHIGKCLVEACADSGSQINCIREGYALYLGASVQPEVETYKLPIRGHFLHSIGHTTLKCRFPVQGGVWIYTKFIVFSRFTSRVLFGLGFLSSTETLSRYRHRLKDIETLGPTKKPPHPIIRCVGNTEMSAVECWINGSPINSLPDTGADLNLISADFAAMIAGRRGNQSTETIKEFDTTTIQFADRSTVTTQGTLRLTISFLEPSKCLTSTHELVAPALAGPSQKTVDRVPSNSRLLETFHIVEGLEQKVILCETLLATVDAFNQYRQNFVASTRDTFDYICVGKEKKGKERGTSVQIRPLEDTSERLTDDYNNASDTYEKEMTNIVDQLLNGEIEEENVPALKAHACGNFSAWARENKARFDRFRPGFYEQKFPAAPAEPINQAQQA